MGVDPALRKAIETRSGTGEPVVAHVTLETPAGKTYLSAEETQAAVRALLDRVRDAVHEAPHAVNVFPNVQSFSVVASALFVQHLLEQPEVAAATGAKTAEDVLIKPVSSRRVGGPHERHRGST